MPKITKCINDWNVAVEVIGQGMQSILIIRIGTALKEFFHYPTVRYINNDNYLDLFKYLMQDFVKKNSLLNGEYKFYKVKYYATVGEVFESLLYPIDKFDDQNIGTKNM